MRNIWRKCGKIPHICPDGMIDKYGALSSLLYGALSSLLQAAVLIAKAYRSYVLLKEGDFLFLRKLVWMMVSVVMFSEPGITIERI